MTPVPPLHTFPLFDEPYGKWERLPRTFRIVLREVEEDGRVCVPMTIKDGIRLGDPQIDNAYIEDGYRFHDALHASFLALFGWSPVLRTLMQRRRSSNPVLYDVEDTGRAVVIEETIVTLVFNFAGASGLRNGVTRIDPALIRTIREITGFLEVQCYADEHWEQAILLGLDCWRLLLQHRRGLLRGNLHQRTMTFEGITT